MPKAKEKKYDVLDSVKEMEKRTKALMLLDAVSKIKGMAREVLELKEETAIILDELGVSKIDSKRIVDFVNSLSDIKLSDKDKEIMREEVKSDIKSGKVGAEAKARDSIEEMINSPLSSSVSSSTSSSNSASAGPATYSTVNSVEFVDNDGGGVLSVSI